MDELTAVDGRSPDEIDVQDAGSTFALGMEGWEASDYVDPASDWSPLADGSFLSPDGLIRTWPLVSHEPP